MSQRHWLFSVLLVSLLSGCASTSPDVTYFTLQPTQPLPEKESVKQAVSVLLGPAEFPAYLLRSQIVTRDENRLHIDDYNRWASGFEGSVMSVLGENIRRNLNTSHIVVYPAQPRFEIDYRVVLDIIQFDGERGEKVIMNVRWMILDASGDKALVVDQHTFKQRTDGYKFDHLVEAYNKLLARLSVRITDKLKELESNKVDTP